MAFSDQHRYVAILESLSIKKRRTQIKNIKKEKLFKISLLKNNIRFENTS